MIFDDEEYKTGLSEYTAFCQQRSLPNSTPENLISFKLLKLLVEEALVVSLWLFSLRS